MKRAILDVIIASLFSLLVYFLSAVILAAVANSSEMNKNLFIAIVCAVTYIIILLHISKIRRGNGEDELYHDYHDSKYVSIRDDIRFVLIRERMYLIVICAIILICYLSSAVYMGILGSQQVFPLSLVFFPMTGFQTLFPFSVTPLLNLVAHLINMVVICVGYLIAVLIYRRRL